MKTTILTLALAGALAAGVTGCADMEAAPSAPRSMAPSSVSASVSSQRAPAAFTPSTVVATPAPTSVERVIPPPPPPPAPVDPVSGTTAAYLAVLETAGVPGTDAQQITLGHMVCSNLDDGISLEAQALVAVESGSESWFGYVMGAAIAGFCPQYQPELDAFVEKWVN